jgi:hypothetical protein
MTREHIVVLRRPVRRRSARRVAWHEADDTRRR